jgi:hypothetical protein
MLILQNICLRFAKVPFLALVVLLVYCYFRFGSDVWSSQHGTWDISNSELKIIILLIVLYLKIDAW